MSGGYKPAKTGVSGVVNEFNALKRRLNELEKPRDAIVPVPYGPRILKTGYSYAPTVPATVSNSTLPINNTLYALPFYVPHSMTATSLSMYVNTLAGTTGGYSVGLYSNSTTDDYPYAKLVDSFFDTSTSFGATGWNTLTISVSLTAGLYWLTSVRQATTAPTVTCLTAGINGDNPLPFALTASLSTTGAISWTQTGVTGVLPILFTSTKTSQAGTVPLVLIGF